MADQHSAAEIDRLVRSMLNRRPLTRRRFLQGSAVAAVPAVLAACGVPAASPSSAPTASGPAQAAGQLNWANWPLYIDIDEDSGAYPSLDKFKAETGITVTYKEDINDNEEFFGKIQPDLQSGRSPGYDLITPTDWMIERLIRLGYVQPLDKSLLPNFGANVQELYSDPWFDPGNVYSATYLSGIVGIGYNPTLTGREITSFDDLLDPAFKGRVGMFSEMRDTMCLTLLSLGTDPANATVDDATRAQQKLLPPAEAGQFRAFYGNDYYDQLAGGNLALTMAWGGDISQMKLYDNPDVEFVVPSSGGMLYSDNFVIAKNVEHPIDAHKMINFWYDVPNATALTEYVGYYNPVKGVSEQILADAETARDEGDAEWADQLEVIATTVMPTEEQLAKLHTYPILDEEAERAWNDLFNAVVIA